MDLPSLPELVEKAHKKLDALHGRLDVFGTVMSRIEALHTAFRHLLDWMKIMTASQDKFAAALKSFQDKVTTEIASLKSEIADLKGKAADTTVSDAAFDDATSALQAAETALGAGDAPQLKFDPNIDPSALAGTGVAG